MEKYHIFFRRQELRELRLLQKEANRAQAVLSAKLETQREQMHRRFDQEMNVSNSLFKNCQAMNLTWAGRETVFSTCLGQKEAL